jgi:hypothetical protein
MPLVPPALDTPYFTKLQESLQQQIMDLRDELSAQQRRQRQRQRNIKYLHALKEYHNRAAEADDTAPALPRLGASMGQLMGWDLHPEVIGMRAVHAARCEQRDTAVLLGAALAVAQCGLLSWLFFSTGNLAICLLITF